MLRTLLLLILCAAAPLAAQDRGAAAGDHARSAPRVGAVAAGEPIRVDGVLDEGAWAAAEPITDFTQLDPDEGAPASERTVVRFLYDEDAIYVGARLYDAHPVTARLGRRDMSMEASDWLTVIFDSHHDHRTAYGFEINPAGVRRDQTRGPGGEDDSWDPVWETATTVTEEGWTAEIRIPFSQLRFSGERIQTWGLQVERTIARNREFAVWAFTPRDEPGGIPRFGHLTGLAAIPTGRRLEVLPYAVARAENVDRSGNPFRSDRAYELDAGLDLKYRVTSNLTLDATVNPDFGQVEVDPAVVNLTAFETFFPEKRPFFIEGAEIFRFAEDGSNSAFYSRRIGRQPSLVPPYPARDVPDATRILGAAKLSGRTAGGWSVGVLDAVTSREIARFRTPTGETGEIVAEPLTNYFVARARQERRQGQTALGGFVGAVNRQLDSDPLADALRSAAYSGGVDLFHQWAERTWTLSGFLAASHVRGEPAVIAAAQRAPYHYFQRPDADHLDYDPTRVSLSGASGALSLSRRVGRHWNGRAGISTITPGYEVSDLGFQRRADRIDLQASLNYSETRPGDILRRWSLFGTTIVEHNYGFENISNRIFSGAFMQFLNYWDASVNLMLSFPGTVDDRLTRGGPAARRPGVASVFARVASDRRRPVAVEVGTSFERDDAGGSGSRTYSDLVLKPSPRWQLSLGPSFRRGSDVAQYLFALPDTLATETYGTRYVFAPLDQTVASLETRLSYTFSPGLSLQLFAQPFVASGDFGPAAEFAAPGTYRFLVYGRDVGEVVNDTIYPEGRFPGAPSFAAPRPDFNIRSLRGNAVLRWEWRPGSTLYLAWQQTRRGFRPTGDFDLGRDTDALFAAAPDDILLIKVTYWLNP